MSVSEPEFITIGEILSPWGIKGKIKVAPTTDFPQRFTPSEKVYINQRPMTIENAEWYKGNAIVKLSGLDTTGEAHKLRGQHLEIHRSQLKSLSNGEYYLFQIIGLEVWTAGGTQLGKVVDVITAPSNDIYVVSGEGEEILIPAIEDVVKSIDLEMRRIVIEPIEGLLTLNSKRPKKTPPKQKAASKKK